MKKSNNNKVWKAPMVLFYFFLFCLLGFYARYFYLATSKVVDGKVMKEFAKNRNTASTILYAKRGTIYDNSKREDDRNILAVNVSSYTVVACLGEKCGSRVVDKQMTAEKLSPISGSSGTKTSPSNFTYHQDNIAQIIELVKYKKDFLSNILCSIGVLRIIEG